MEYTYETMHDEYKGKGLTGLANIGNTCYLNSCLQILSHTYELTDFLKNGMYKKKLNNKPDSLLLVEWDKLRTMMWSANCTIAPYGFVKAVQKISLVKGCDLFTGHAQNDIQEFLLFLVDCFHEALARSVNMTITGNVKNSKDKLAKDCYQMMKQMYHKEYSEILNIFYGIHVSVVTKLNSNDVLSTHPEPFSVINLPLPNIATPTIYDCFDCYCYKEELVGNNKYEMANKEKVDAEKGIIFWSLPNVLILDLKRWRRGGNKIHTNVRAPITNADFSKYVKGYVPEQYVYDLYGVCNHSGGTLGGHYVACVKNANGCWYEFNDTSVKQISETSIISSNTYCFFYRKKK